MKTIFTLFIALFCYATSFTQVDVDLTLTYHGKAVCFYEVELKHGDVVIAKGKTDAAGHVHFSDASIISNQVDISAKKKGVDAEYEFSVNGYITLDENHAAEFHLEKLLEEMTADSGMPESMFAEGWGLMTLDCH